jgi:nitroimidazol reductase NimA-like FMN-containing flavoprotein (pyridoxamine 5'-phosphate oxidase superfamily)
VLSEDECRALLEAHDVGRVGFVIDDLPVVLPVNYAVVGDTIVVRTAPGVLTAGVSDRPVAFEIDGFERWNRSGWSVLAQGHGRDIAEEADNRGGALRSSEVDTWAPGDRAVSLTIDITHLSGRRIARPPTTSSSTYE